MLAVVGKLHPSDNLCKTKNMAQLVIILPGCVRRSIISPTAIKV